MKRVKNKSLKKIAKYSLRTLEGVFAFLFLYLIIAIFGEIIPTGNLNDDGQVCIYVQSNGVHTDVCLPVHSKVVDWDDFISTDDYADTTSIEYISIGWGDKGFFLHTPTWAELKVSTALNAAFLPSSSAMHVRYSEEPSESDLKRKVYISEKDYKRMVKYIKRSFHYENNRVDLIPNSGYTESDNFYEANDSYHLFRTCNIWTNEALKNANIKTGLFALFPSGIMRHLKP